MYRRKPRLGLRILYPGFVVLTLAISFWWVGCSGCQSPPTVSVPASNLDVNFSISDITETPSDNKVIVVMQFLQNGNVVQLASDATTSCNGVALTYNGLLFGNAGRVPLVQLRWPGKGEGPMQDQRSSRSCHRPFVNDSGRGACVPVLSFSAGVNGRPP